MSIETLIQAIGYPLVFGLIAAESTGVPLPGEITLLAAAAAAGAGRGGFNIWLVFLFAAAGAIAGGTAGYWIGRRGGRALIERLSGRFGLNPDHIGKAERFFDHHGGSTVFFGRWVSYLRILTSLLAGISKMPFPKFMLFNILSGIFWAGVVSFLGFKFGRHLDVVERIMREIGIGIFIAAVLAVAGYLVIAKVFIRRDSSRR